MTAARITITIIFGILPCLGAQEPADLLERASLVESREGDLGAALALYARVADDDEADLGTRSTAQLRKALIEKKLGREAAARRSLEQAASGAGASAERARALLEQKSFIQDEDWQVSGRIHRAIAKLYSGDTYQEGINDLALIGGAGVPPLAEAMRNEKSDIAFLGRGVIAMVRIGGPRVAKWFSGLVRDPDTIYRRTVMDRLEDRTQKTSAAELRTLVGEDDLISLLDDPDLDVAGHALTLLGRMDSGVALERVLAFYDRCDANRLAGKIYELVRLGFDQRAARDPELRARLLRGLVALAQRKDAALGTRIESIVSTLSHRMSEEGYSFWFEFAVSVPTGIEGMIWRGRNAQREPSDFGLADALGYLDRIPAEEIEAYRKLAQEFRKETRTGALVQTIDGIASSKSAIPEEVPAALEIIARIGPDPALRRLEDLIWKTALPGQVQRAVELIESFDQPSFVAYAIGRLYREPAALDISPLLDHLKRRAAETPPSAEGEFIQGTIGQFVQPLVLRQDPTNLKALMGLLEVDSRFYYPLCERMTKIDLGVALEHLLTLIAREDEGPLADSARNLVFQRLLDSGDERAIPALIEAAKLGLRFSSDYTIGNRKKTYPAPTPRHHGIAGVFDVQQLGVWKEEQLARIVGGVLEVGGDRPWFDLARSYDSNSDKWQYFSEPLRRLIEHRVFDAPASVRRKMIESILGFPARIVEPDRFIPAVLAQPDLQLSADAIDAIPRPYSETMRALVARILTEETSRDIVEAALKSVRYAKEPALRAGIRRHLASEDANLRRRALQALVANDRESAIPEILALAADESGAVREELCASLALVPDRRSVPVLIELLKDPGANVREKADAALRQVQFYFEQKDRWEKWLKGAGLESENAAEALLKQAAPDQPKAQRLVAIASLGTLGVPETLPILIGWMSDADAEIAAAAKAAVDKINGN